MKKIVIVDFGGQYTHMIARRVRECQVYSEIVNPAHFVPDADTAGIIFSGSPRSVTDESLTSVQFALSAIQVPLLGICYGHQLIAKLSGGAVESHQFREYGNVPVILFEKEFLFKGLDEDQSVWMSHGDTVVSLPDDFVITAASSTTPVCSYRHVTKPIFGVQFHPEVSHTINGGKIIENFIRICAIDREWKIENLLESLTGDIRSRSNGRKLLLLISGGVDSLVALALCARAVGPENIIALHVDTGLMRYRESEQVMHYLEALNLSESRLINVLEKFLSRLSAVSEPEEKRRIIGAAFVETMHDFLAARGSDLAQWILVQGTIYPDTIESGGTQLSGAIKTHHNRVPEIEAMIEAGNVIEPLREFYKDEVRELGMQLGLPPALVQRRPFPGPGLAIRILAAKNPYPLTEEEEMQAKLFGAQKGLQTRILPIKSVGVQGDDRTYRHPLLLWSDTQTPLSWHRIKQIAAMAVNTQPAINRVIFSPVPVIEKIAIQPLAINAESVRVLQLVDAVVQDMTEGIAEIWQLPVVSLPLFTENGKQCFVLRPIVSADAMTADVYEMEQKLLLEIIEKLKEIPEVGYVFYDVTTKPPATIEWE
jgi:GMP synthase (glutamine-hydrolysing)